MSGFGPLEWPTDPSRIFKFDTVVPRTDEQVGSDQLLGEVLTSYEVPIQSFVYDQDLDPEVWDQIFGGGPSLMWVYIGHECIGSLQWVDGGQRFFPLTLLWEGDQA